MIKIVIFDFDGTLADTQQAIVISKQETMRQLGLPVADEAACISTIGLTAKGGFELLFPDLDAQIIEKCVDLSRVLFEETKEKYPPVVFPGVLETLEQLGQMGIVCTVASSRNKASLMSFLESMGIMKYFEYILGGEDTKLQKPNPEPVVKTLGDLSFAPEQTLVIGDMTYDIKMGKGAGAYACGVTYGNEEEAALVSAGADYIIDDITKLIGICDGSEDR